MRKTSLPYFREFPKNFRKEDTLVIIKSIESNSHLQFIGSKGCGKSLVFRALLQSGYAKKYQFYLIDLNLIPERSSLSILNLIYGAMSEWKIDGRLNEGEIVVRIQNKLNEIEKLKKKVVFIFDSFENLADVENKFLFKSLATLVDQNRDMVTCIFSLEKEVDGKILDVFTDKYFIKPLNKADFDWFIQGLQENYSSIIISSEVKKMIYQASGGYMAVAKRMFEAVISGIDLPELIRNPKLSIHLAYQLDLIIESGGDMLTSIPILDTYKKNKNNPDQVLDEIGDLKIDKRLTASEHKLLEFLLSKKGKITTRDDSIDAVWGKFATKGVADHALDQLVHRLNSKLKNSSVKLETVRGRGHILK